MLQQRCSRLESMLKALYPQVNLDDYVGPPIDHEDFDLRSYQEQLRALSIPEFPTIKPLPPSRIPSHSPITPSSLDSTEQLEESDEEDIPVTKSVARGYALNGMEIGGVGWRHHGKTSGAHLLCHYQEIKGHTHGNVDFFESLGRHRTEPLWRIPEWEYSVTEAGLHPLDYSDWPDQGLDQQLIGAYFDHVNINLPLLNWALFQREYDAGLWKTNHRFGRVCLLIFACGSLFFKTPATLWPSPPSHENDPIRLSYSSGWKYLLMALNMGENSVRMPDLYQLQSQTLICYFMQAGTLPHFIAAGAGSALRSTQELGIHLKQVLDKLDPTTKELYKRAFWCLYHLDRYNSATLGRSVAMTERDFNVPFPEDVDDEYWVLEGGGVMRQPEGKVSKVAAFIQMLKLDQILGKVLGQLYPARKADSDTANRRAVAVELDLALAEWAKNVPSVLRWDPDHSNYTLLQQTSCIWGFHWFIKILLHRNLIPPRPNVATIDQISSLAECVAAALSISSITSATLQRGRLEGCQPGKSLDIFLMVPSWLAATVLLVSIYTMNNTATERQRAVNGIKMSLEASKELGALWKLAAKTGDFLEQYLRDIENHNGDKSSRSDTVPNPTKLVAYATSQWSASSPDSEEVSQRGLFNSWLKMNMFEAQIAGMNNMSLGNGEETFGEEWWERMLSNQM
ncbi:hypothetical protein L202_01099 [Cryptococcus amylolentus CBS 6039]|uniref:Xylanolytic transcriptional activator regulatory domain-containing protein n=1 Tax=Cryptococcus amylolentus CBS 6039 TaxID=1295533 RepID=A0A1E3I395_9TREE|nr:hypothetical protein L202_01099 [Cryptococcus amylolentus CBS 6039]ODN82835.1 hypothetical protein L202_01099 [Cryptococcus amylolentus CBS 6039]